MVKLLVCNCGDCTHWEIVKDDEGVHLRCKTCNVKVAIEFSTMPSEVVPVRWEERPE